MNKPTRLGSPKRLGERGAKIGVYGEYGTGKTQIVMSSVEIGHLLLHDTEGRSQYYDPKAEKGFEVVYSTDIQDSIDLLLYTEELHGAGEKVVFAVDSFSSLWFSQQEVAERLGATKRGTARFDSWGPAKKPLKKFYALLYNSPVDCIITMRSKPKYEVEKSASGSDTPKAMGYDTPDTERGLNYAVDLVIELQKEQLPPGTPLKPENFWAIVVKTSGPREGNPLPIGMVIRDPSFEKLTGLRLKGNGKGKIAEANLDLQVLQASITTIAEFEKWIVEDRKLDKATVYARLKEKFGHFDKEKLPDYVADILATTAAEKGDGKAEA